MRFQSMGVLLVATLLIPLASAEATLWFVGDGSDVIGASPNPSLALVNAQVFPMSVEGHGGQETHMTTVAGNANNNNPYLPTFYWDTSALTLTASDEIQVFHYASVSGADIGCGLIGNLYDASGAVIASQTITAPSFDVEEFAFTYTGLEGSFDVLRFQAVQSSNQCGWATIDHYWGTDGYPGRMVVPEHVLTGGPVAGPIIATVFADLETSNAELDFENATSDDYVFNFTNDLPAAVAAFSVNGTGIANATLIDADGIELFNGTVETVSMDLGNVTTGDWQLLVDFTEFNGTFAFELMGPQDVEETAEATDDAAGDAAEADADGGDALGNETVDGAADDAEAPGPALPFMAVALMAVAFLARRRF